MWGFFLEWLGVGFLVYHIIVSWPQLMWHNLLLKSHIDLCNSKFFTFFTMVHLLGTYVASVITAYPDLQYCILLIVYNAYVFSASWVCCSLWSLGFACHVNLLASIFFTVPTFLYSFLWYMLMTNIYYKLLYNWSWHWLLLPYWVVIMLSCGGVLSLSWLCLNPTSYHCSFFVSAF